MIQAGGAAFQAVWNNKFRGWGAFCKIVPPQINPLGSRVERGRNGSDYIGGNYSLGGSVLSAQGGERTQWIGTLVGPLMFGPYECHLTLEHTPKWFCILEWV